MSEAIEDKWLRADEVYDHLDGQGLIPPIGNPDALQLWLRTGVLKAHAQKIITQPKGAEPQEQLDVVIPGQLWGQVFDGTLPQLSWREGMFCNTRFAFGTLTAERVFLVGVRFSRANLDELVPLSLKPKTAAEKLGILTLEQPIAPPVATKLKRGGGRPKSDNWSQFWFAVIKIADERRLNRGTFKTKTALLEEIMEIMPEGAFHEDTIEPFVIQVWDRFVEPKGG